MSIEKTIDLGLDVNSLATITTVVNVEGLSSLGFHMKEDTGNHAGTIWRMYCSPDGSTWFKTSLLSSAQVNLIDTAEVFNCSGTSSIRFQVDTASGGAGTEDITVILQE